MAQQIDALTLLKKDHDLAKDLMARVDKEKDVDERTSMFEQLIDALTIHERIEEEIFYPALQRLPNAREDVLESFEEHHLVDQIITGLDNTAIDSETWPAKFTVLKENVEHHIQDEEEKLFPKADKLLGREKLGELGARMADLKEAEENALAEELDEEEIEQETAKD